MNIKMKIEVKRLKVSFLDGSGVLYDSEKGNKIPVTFIGWQENLPGRPPLPLINEPSGTTKIYNPEKHILKNPGEIKNEN